MTHKPAPSMIGHDKCEGTACTKCWDENHTQPAPSVDEPQSLDELCPFHDLGNEFSKCDCLEPKHDCKPYTAAQSEITALKAELAEARKIISRIPDFGPCEEPSKDKACWFCDMGAAGYSSKGDGYHDDECLWGASRDYLNRHKGEV